MESESMIRKTTFKIFSNITEQRTISKILGIQRVPTDRFNKTLIRMKREMVNNVLPEGYFGVIFTPILNSCDMKGNVITHQFGRQTPPDDVTYKLYPEIQNLMPRCYSVLLIFEKESELLVARHVLQGYYKFGGAAKDEDSNINTHCLIDKETLNEATRMIVTEKSNGKAAVITMFTFKDELYVFGGSKAKHYIGKMEKGILTFGYLSKDLFAWQIFNCFFETWNTMTPEAQEELVYKLIREKDSAFDGYTLCAEYEDGKHMIPLPEGVANRIVMFGMVKNIGSQRQKDEPFCEDVESAMLFFERTGLPFTPYEIRDYGSDVEQFKAKLRDKKGVEGYVIHYQKKTDSGYHTICVEKFKTWVYIILRVVREFVMSVHDLEKIDWKRRLRLRMEKRNVDYMNMPSDMLRKWNKLCENFIQWMLKTKLDPKTIGYNTNDKGMGNTWNQFLKENPQLDYEIKTPESYFVADKNAKPKGTLFIFQGIPGLGKSAVSSDLVSSLRKRGVNAVSLEQDVFFEAHGKKKSIELCQKQMKEYVSSGKCDAVLLMRNNANWLQYRQYATIAAEWGWKVHAICPRNFKGDLRTLAVCLYSVYSRSADTKNPHPTFKNLQMAKRYAITLAFFVGFEKAKKIGSVSYVTEIDWLQRDPLAGKPENPINEKTNGLDNIRKNGVIGDGRKVAQNVGASSVNADFANFNNGTKPSLTEKSNSGRTLSTKATKFLEQLYSNVSKYKNPFSFDAQRIDVDAVSKFLEFEKIDYHSWRVPKHDLVQNIVDQMMRTSLKQFAEPAFINKRVCLEKTSETSKNSEKNSEKSTPDELTVTGRMLYLYVPVPQDIFLKLIEIIENLELDTTLLTVKPTNPHLTLIYQDKHTPVGKRIWARCLEMAKQNQTVSVSVNGLALWAGKLVCFTCTLYDTASGANLLPLVASGHPHITTMHSPTTSPVQSLAALKMLSSSNNTSKTKYFRLTNPVDFESSVKVFYKS